jgi:glycosyltransferase involved in cell wall biosynthesis
LDLPPRAKLILMGADGGVRDPRKGGDLLRAAISKIIEKTQGEDVRLMVYGQDGPSAGEPPWSCPVQWLGEVRDDRVLALAYAAADVMVVPSRQDNLPNTAVEAHTCGLPVVAFDIGGLPDIVEHQITGWLAPAFDTESLAHGIEWVLADEPRAKALGVQARERAVARISPARVASEYMRVYQNVLKQ